MPSLAARILELHAQKKSRDEIQRETRCTGHYLRSVLSRASAPDEATRRLRNATDLKGTLGYAARLAGWHAYNEILRMGGSKTQARAASRERRRAYLRAHQFTSAKAGAVQRVQPTEAHHA